MGKSSCFLDVSAASKMMCAGARKILPEKRKHSCGYVDCQNRMSPSSNQIAGGWETELRLDANSAI